MQAEEGSNVLLRCELSKPGIPVDWSKGQELLKNGVKYQLKRRETTLELLIWKPVPEDSGVYCCQCTDQVTSATVTITGKTPLTNWLIGVSDVMVLNQFRQIMTHLSQSALCTRQLSPWPSSRS